MLALPGQPVWLTVLRFALSQGETASEDPAPLDEFLDRLGDDERVLYDSTGDFDSDDAWQAVVKVLTGYALAAFERSRAKDRTDVL